MPTINPLASTWLHLALTGLGMLQGVGVTPIPTPQGGTAPLWVFVAGQLLAAATSALSSAKAGPLAPTPLAEPPAGAKKS